MAVVIPALDEEIPLPRVLASLPRPLVDRVVVVDNGSRDRTVEVALQGGAEVVRHPQKGYGGACMAGIRHLIPDPPHLLVILDADGSDDPSEMPGLLQPVAQGEAEMVIGSRVLGTFEKGSLTLPQRFGNALATGIIGGWYHRKFTDLGPFRAVDFQRLLALGMEDPTWGWNVEMHLKGLRAGWRIAEIPVPYRRRLGKSKISGTVSGTVRAGVRILWALHHYR